jgi:hypothetical protein
VKYLYLDTSYLNKISNEDDKDISLLLKNEIKNLLINKEYELIISDTHLQEIYDREDIINIKRTIDFLCKYKSLRACPIQEIIDLDIENALEIFFGRKKTMPRFSTYLQETADSNVDETIKDKEKGKEKKQEASKNFNVEREKGIQWTSELDKNQKRLRVITALKKKYCKECSTIYKKK